MPTHPSRLRSRPGFQGLYLVCPPYQAWEPIEIGWRPPADRSLPGAAVVWFMGPTETVHVELAWVEERPRSLPFFVVLPEPEEIRPLAPVLRHVPSLEPKGVLPNATTGTLHALRTLLAAPPPSLPESATSYLERIGMVRDWPTRQRVLTIFRRAPHISSIDKLSRELCQSRRTLGRYFRERELPVPSHWLQFARLLHVAVQLQNTRTNIGRVSARYGFTDGFTMSNAMKRLTGYRPSFVREHLGWEWLVEAWVRKEGWG